MHLGNTCASSTNPELVTLQRRTMHTGYLAGRPSNMLRLLGRQGCRYHFQPLRHVFSRAASNQGAGAAALYTRLRHAIHWHIQRCGRTQPRQATAFARNKHRRSHVWRPIARSGAVGRPGRRLCAGRWALQWPRCQRPVRALAPRRAQPPAPTAQMGLAWPDSGPRARRPRPITHHLHAIWPDMACWMEAPSSRREIVLLGW